MSDFTSVDDFVMTLVLPVVCLNCFSIGFIMKHHFYFVDNKKIPLIVSLLGIFFNIWLHNWDFNNKILIEGFIGGLSSVGLNELFKKKY